MSYDASTPTPLTLKAAEVSARQKSVASGNDHYVVPHPTVSDKYTAVQSPAWRETFKRVVEQDPESLGIHDEESANQAALQHQQINSVTAGGLGKADGGDYGDVGTRNESIYPTR